MCTTIFLFYLWLVTNFPHSLFSVWFWNLYLLYCNWIQKCWYCFPSEPDCSWCIDSEHFIQFTTVVQWHFSCTFFNSVHWYLCNTHSSQIINNNPTFNLTRNKHIFDDLLMNINWGNDSWFNIFKVNKFSVENQYWSETKVSSNRIEEARFLFFKLELR